MMDIVHATVPARGLRDCVSPVTPATRRNPGRVCAYSAPDFSVFIVIV
ncbi:hypothetical protein [Paenibacillus sp. GYB003]